MGNSLTCISPDKKKVRKKGFTHPPQPPRNSVGCSSERKSLASSYLDEDLAEQAIAAAMLFRHHQKNGSLPFPRSHSLVYPSQTSTKPFTKSSTSKQRPSLDHLLKPARLDAKIDDVETKHVMLVHGGGFGGWCWYKVVTLLEENGVKVDAIDLTASGTHSSDPNTITSLSQYIQPLIDFLHNLKQGHQVILVGHDIGGACISYVMELFPSKIAKSIFIAAPMLSNGQSAFDVLSRLQTDATDLMRQAQLFIYGNGKNYPPTAITLDKPFLKDLLFNQTSPKDIALATLSMRAIPIAPVLEKLCLSKKKYGSIPRFYIKTQQDFAIPLPLQEAIINSSPPQQVFMLKGSDHAPFFSKPQALHRILLQILQIPPNQS